MQRLGHTLGGRIAAVLVAAALSGAAQAVPPKPAGPHRCLCGARGGASEAHVCACPICRAEARRARAAAARDASAPACHRAAAAKASAAEEDGERRRDAAACLVASCGAPERGLAAPRALDGFTLPRPPASARVEWSTSVAVPVRRAPARAVVPDVPPPRA